MKYTSLGIIVGLFYWATERVWTNPELLLPLLYLSAGGAVVGGILDFLKGTRRDGGKPQNSARDDIQAKKRAYLEKLKQKKAGEKDSDHPLM